MCVCVCVCVCGWVGGMVRAGGCVRACVRACVYRFISGSTRSILTERGSLFFVFVLFRIREENNFVWFTDTFLFYVEFLILEKFVCKFF